MRVTLKRAFSQARNLILHCHISKEISTWWPCSSTSIHRNSVGAGRCPEIAPAYVRSCTGLPLVEVNKRRASRSSCTSNCTDITMPLIKRLVKTVAAGIGAGREAYESHKRSKEQQQHETGAGPSTSAPPPEYEEVSEERARELIAKGEAVPVDTDTKHLSPKGPAHGEVSEGEESEEDDDEIAWELDEAQEAADPPSYEAALEDGGGSGEEVDVPELVRGVLHKVGSCPGTIKRMPYPIVIPQRRPRSKKRGFVRAYPPILDNYGISQDAFLTLLKNFHQASKPSKYIAAVFVAAGIVGMVPSVYVMAVSTAVQFAAGTAPELQRRYRANTFLDQLNE